jgi:hypothetical protein
MPRNHYVSIGFQGHVIHINDLARLAAAMTLLSHQVK